MSQSNIAVPTTNDRRETLGAFATAPLINGVCNQCYTACTRCGYEPPEEKRPDSRDAKQVDEV